MKSILVLLTFLFSLNFIHFNKYDEFLELAKKFDLKVMSIDKLVLHDEKDDLSTLFSDKNQTFLVFQGRIEFLANLKRAAYGQNNIMIEDVNGNIYNVTVANDLIELERFHTHTTSGLSFLSIKAPKKEYLSVKEAAVSSGFSEAITLFLAQHDFNISKECTAGGHGSTGCSLKMTIAGVSIECGTNCASGWYACCDTVSGCTCKPYHVKPKIQW